MKNIRKTILSLADNNDRVTTHTALAALNHEVSRQAVSYTMRQLVREGLLGKSGHTRGAFYTRPGAGHLAVIERRFRNDGLEEHVILQELKTAAPFLRALPDHVESIFDYAFDEMMNNAIEHSRSKSIAVEVRLDSANKSVTFRIKDTGVGVFRNVMQKRNLKNEHEAIQDLLKGKITTAPQAHSGEGIFFTSKAVDVFTLSSFGHELRIDNRLPDIFVLPSAQVNKGTIVTCEIDLATQRHLSDIFKKYQSNDDTYAFDKTEVQVRLYTMGTIYISRSQARRLLSGLEKFKKVILDFDRVPTVGQAFADEVFRVFASRHPDIELAPVNMNEAVRFMMERARAAK